MLKRIVAMLLVVLSLSLQACVSPTSGFKSFVDTTDGYRFFYPNGWQPVRVGSGPDIVFHDIIHPSENVSVVINPTPSGKKLQDLGTPSEVGYKLGKSAIAPPDSGRTAELVSAEVREVLDKTYYLLEYVVKIGDRTRHSLASVAINRGKLYTINASTSDERWEKMHEMLQRTIRSFAVD